MSRALTAASRSLCRRGMFSSSLKSGTMTETWTAASAAARRPARARSASLLMNLLDPCHLGPQPSLEIERGAESQRRLRQGTVGKRMAGVAGLRRPADDPGALLRNPFEQLDDGVHTHTGSAAYVIDPLPD